MEAVQRSNEDRERQFYRTLIRVGKLTVPVLFGMLIVAGVLFAWHRYTELAEHEEQERRALQENHRALEKNRRALDELRSRRDEADRNSQLVQGQLQERLASLQAQSEKLNALVDEQSQKAAVAKTEIKSLTESEKG